MPYAEWFWGTGSGLLAYSSRAASKTAGVRQKVAPDLTFTWASANAMYMEGSIGVGTYVYDWQVCIPVYRYTDLCVLFSTCMYI